MMPSVRALALVVVLLFASVANVDALFKTKKSNWEGVAAINPVAIDVPALKSGVVVKRHAVVVVPDVHPDKVLKVLSDRGVDIATDTLASNAVQNFLHDFLTSSMTASTFQFHLDAGHQAVDLVRLKLSRESVITVGNSAEPPQLVNVSFQVFSASANYNPVSLVSKQHTQKKKKWNGNIKVHRWTTQEHVPRGFTTGEISLVQNALLERLAVELGKLKRDDFY